MKAKADRTLELLGSERLSAAAKEETERLARELKEELRSEYKRLTPERVQRTFTTAESAFYFPSIHGAWVAISSLRVDGTAKKAWYNDLEETSYKLGKHL
jgi:hypothetical protein